MHCSKLNEKVGKKSESIQTAMDSIIAVAIAEDLTITFDVAVGFLRASFNLTASTDSVYRA